MCNVIVPFTSLEDGVVAAIEASGRMPILHDVSGSDEDYWELLAGLWELGESFVVVEQDIVVRADTLDSFDDCPNGWCAAGYPYLGSQNYAGLGCTRFRAEFIEKHRDLIELAGEFTNAEHPKRHWCTLDAAMQFALRDRGLFACTDHGTVEHLGDQRPSHGCCG